MCTIPGTFPLIPQLIWLAIDLISVYTRWMRCDACMCVSYIKYVLQQQKEHSTCIHKKASEREEDDDAGDGEREKEDPPQLYTT